MKKVIIVCGVIGGLISGGWFIISEQVFSHNMSLSSLTWLGYASMILAFSLIFVGVKSFRENYNDGQITFGKAFRIGLLITIVTSTLYVIIWLVCYKFFYPDFMEKYAATVRQELQSQGASAADIKIEMAKLADYAKLYKNPLFNILMTYMEIFPVGFVISLITALILKKKPATQVALNQLKTI
jgi:hypothetical protein